MTMITMDEKKSEGKRKKKKKKTKKRYVEDMHSGKNKCGRYAWKQIKFKR